jgi:hypothetical protein
MPTVFRQAVVTDIGQTPVDVLQIPPGVRATVIGCNLANVTEYDTVNVNVKIIDENSTEATYVNSIAVPPNSALKLITQGEKLIVPETAGIRISCDVNDSIDATISYVEIS